MTAGPGAPQGPRMNRILGSLKDALVAASREDTIQPVQQVKAEASAAAAATATPEVKAQSSDKAEADKAAPARAASPGLSAGEAAREARGASSPDRHVELDAPPTTRVLRVGAAKSSGSEPDRTQRVRGKANVTRGEFHQDPVVAWLVVVGGLGLGAYRPVFEGNNTIGRASTQRIPLDFGDDAISSEEQAYIRYDSSQRSFLFVPNLAKTNIVSINEKRPTGAVDLNHMDVITMGRTQLVFVPFCGSDFDWSELADAKA